MNELYYIDTYNDQLMCWQRHKGYEELSSDIYQEVEKLEKEGKTVRVMDGEEEIQICNGCEGNGGGEVEWFSVEQDEYYCEDWHCSDCEGKGYILV